MKLIDKGGVVLAMSDSKGYIYEKDGFSQEQLDQVRRMPHFPVWLLWRARG